MRKHLARLKSSDRIISMNEYDAAPKHLVEANSFKEKHFYPEDITPFENQVAGHSSENGKSSLGLLKNNNGYVLKPIIRPTQGNREKTFYADLQLATDAESVELKSFVPDYLGSIVLKVDTKDVEFLILKNITQDFVEPCIMDIKIGKQTWDPEATREKRENEEKKYAESKRDLGFCIPGFQVHKISTGKVVRMEKDYGKTLTKHTTKDALKLFLNADSGLSRRLLLQLLAHLWRILRWCRSQHRYRFYSSSLLLVYDAKRLRQCVKPESMTSIPRPLTPISFGSQGSPVLGGELSPGPLSPSPSRNITERRSLRPLPPISFVSQGNQVIGGESSPGPLSPSRIKRTLSRTLSRSGSSSPVNRPSSPTPPSTPLQNQNNVFAFDSWHASFDKVCLSRTHSFVNNYEKDLEHMKDDYLFQLDDLMRSDKPGDKEVWSTVKMIDFAHAFPAPNNEEDLNYLEGIENLVKMIEELMQEATC